tara:strand:- start:28145 stop:28660 length:516 start_codon:yes stop_codon:yes gene_type:complete
MSDNNAGVVLVGGQSSRMGANKALLEYKGKPLIEHMADILKSSGLQNIIFSGQIDGYQCTPDDTPFEGPAKAMFRIVEQNHHYDGFVFVPIDMPLLNPKMLHLLMEHKDGCYFSNWPLPCYIKSSTLKSQKDSVQDLLNENGINSIDLPDQYVAAMVNANTPDDWKKVVNL